MRYLVDSDWVADYLKGRPNAVSLLTSRAHEGLAISLITYGEIYYGGDVRQNERAFLQFLRGVEVLALTKSIMKEFAAIRGELRRSGEFVADPDLLIAATTRYHQLTLLTRNVRHFRRIPGLSVYDSPQAAM